MATANTAARDEAANDFATDYATATLTLKAGASNVAVHTLAGFGAAASGVITANAVADVTNAATGTIDSAELTQAGRTYTLTVGVAGSGADVIIGTVATDLDYVSGGTSTISSLAVTF